MQHRKSPEVQIVPKYVFFSLSLSLTFSLTLSQNRKVTLPLTFRTSVSSSSPLNAKPRFHPELFLLNPYCFNTFYFRFIIFSFLLPHLSLSFMFLSLHASFSHTGYPNSTRHSQFILFLFSFFGNFPLSLSNFSPSPLSLQFLFPLSLTHPCQKHKKRKEWNCLFCFPVLSST